MNSLAALASQGTTPDPRFGDGVTSLRRFTREDAAAFAAIHRDALNVKWTSSEADMDAERAAELIDSAIAQGWDEGSSLRFAVTERVAGSETVIGTASLHDVFRSKSGGSASVGIKMLAAGRGTGSATRAVELLTGYAFGTLGLGVLHWRTSVGNDASRDLALRCGFVFAAEIPGYGHVDGEVADGWLLSESAAQWDHHVNGPAPVPELDIDAIVPRLSDGTVVLRALGDADAPQLVANCVNPESIRWTTVPLGYTLEHADFFINTLTVDGWRKRDVLTFAVADAVTDELLGTVDLQCKNPGTAAIGINFGEHARGTGTAERAVRILADYAFNQINLSYLHWSALVPNWGSRKLAWKLGFTFEGEIRGDFNDRGTPRDRWILTLAAGDPMSPPDPWTGPVRPGL